MWLSEGRVSHEEGTASVKTYRKEDAHLVAGTARKPQRFEQVRMAIY